MARNLLFSIGNLLAKSAGAAVVALLLVGCAAPKTVAERHHHHSEVDTVAVQAQVDKRMSDWREVVVKEVSMALEQQQIEQQATENSKERVAETITTWVDSLGRQVRQEQRTTERHISRWQQMHEQRMQQEMTSRLQQVADSLNEVWQTNFDRFRAHWEEADSTATEVKPAAEDNRPWWKRWHDAAWWMVVGAVVVPVVVVAIRKLKG